MGVIKTSISRVIAGVFEAMNYSSSISYDSAEYNVSVYNRPEVVDGTQTLYYGPLFAV